MGKTVVSIRLSDQAIQALDHFAKSIPLSRSRLIETLVGEFLEQDFITQGVALRAKLLTPRDKTDGE